MGEDGECDWAGAYGELPATERSSLVAEPTLTDEWNHRPLLLLSTCCVDSEQFCAAWKSWRKSPKGKTVPWLHGAGTAGPHRPAATCSPELLWGARQRLCSEGSPQAMLFWLFNQHLQLSVDILETKPRALERTKWTLCLWAIRNIRNWSWTVVWTLDTYLPERRSLCTDLALRRIVVGESWHWRSLREPPSLLLTFPRYTDPVFTRQWR